MISSVISRKNTVRRSGRQLSVSPKISFEGGSPPVGPQVIFSASLLSSAISEIGANKNPTFTRATASSVYDFEGHGWQVKSGEIPFYGARRDENLVSVKSEDWTNAAWTKTIGTVTATTLTSTGANQTVLQTYTGTGDFIFRVEMSRISGTGNIDLTLNGGTNWTTVTLTGSNLIFSISGTGLTNPQFGIRIVTSGNAINATKAELEIRTGSTNTNPSDYTSVGVLSSPYSGNGIDAIKCFTNQNGNSVSSNVVTETPGTAISDAVLKGFSCSTATTNTCTYSQDLTNAAWANVGTPTVTAVTQNNGYETLDTIDDTSNTVLQGRRNTIAFTGDGTKSISFIIKQGTSTSNQIRLKDATGPVRMRCNISWSGGVPTISMSVGSEEKPKIALVNGCYRIYTLAPSVVAANTNYLEVYPAADASLGISLTGSLLFGCLQTENRDYSGPYLKTTSAAVTANASILSYLTSGNINASSGAIAITFENSTSTVYTGYLWSSYTDANNSASVFFNGTTLTFRKRIAGVNYDATVAYVYTYNDRTTIVCTWGAAGINIYVNSTTGTPHANTANLPLASAMHIGNDGNSGNLCSGYIRDLEIYDTQLTDSEALAIAA